MHSTDSFNNKNKMKTKIAFAILITFFVSCMENKGGDVAKQSPISVVGTWKLITGMVIEKNDTVTTDYTKNISFVKLLRIFSTSSE